MHKYIVIVEQIINVLVYVEYVQKKIKQNKINVCFQLDILVIINVMLVMFAQNFVKFVNSMDCQTIDVFLHMNINNQNIINVNVLINVQQHVSALIHVLFH